MSAYNALKHFIRAEAELFVSTFSDEPIGVVASGAILSLTWKGQPVVTISASLPSAKGDGGVVSVYKAGAFPHEYVFMQAARYDVRKVVETAIAEARTTFWRQVDLSQPF